MLILTHQGPGYRSKLVDGQTAAARAEQLQADPQYTGVTILESHRSQHPTVRYFVVCLPASEEKRAELLAQFQAERLERAEREGPEYVWAPDPDHPFWHVATLSGEVYEVDTEGRTCTCRDFGVCRDNGLRCKHLLAFERKLGTFLSPEEWGRLRLLAERAGQPPAPRQPVASPVASPVAA